MGRIIKIVFSNTQDTFLAFFSGMGYVIDLGGSLGHTPPPTKKKVRDDMQSLRQDWIVIGDDLRHAIEHKQAELHA